jgi:hypothetical protein
MPATQLAPMSAPQQSSSAFPPAMYAYAPPTNSLAVASLVAGILSWVLCPLLGAVLAVIFGHVARGQIKQRGEGGGGMAIAGLVMGYANLGLTVLGIVVWIFLFAGLAIFGAAIGGGTSFPSPSPSG